MRIFISMFFLFIAFFFVAKAEDTPKVSLGIVSSPNASAAVPVMVNNFNEIKSFDLRIAYDAEIALPKNISKGTGLSGGLAFDTNTSGVIKIIWNAPAASTSSLSDGSELLTILFDKVKAGKTTLFFDETADFYDCQFYNKDGALYDLPADSFYVSGSLAFEPIVDPDTLTPIITINTVYQPAVCGGNGSVSLTFTDVPDGNYEIFYGTGSFSDVEISAGAATIAAPAGVYNNLQLTVNGKTSGLGVDATLVNPPLPIVEILNNSGSTELSCFHSEIQLTGAGGADYTWYSNEEIEGMEAELLVSSPGTYVLSVRDEKSCVASDSLVITQSYTLPTAHIINHADSTILSCNVQEIELSATGGASYKWFLDGIVYNETADIEVNTPGRYVAMVIGKNGCVAKDSIMITQETEIPVASISNATGTRVLSCKEPSIAVLAGGGKYYQWSDGINELGNEASISIVSPGTYYVQVTGENGCFSSDSITVTRDVSVPELSIENKSGTTELNCKVQTIDLEAFGNGAFSWTDGTNVIGDAALLNIETPGTFTIELTAENGCIASGQITITEDIQKPVVEITNHSGKTALSETDTIIFLTASGGEHYSWSNGLEEISTSDSLSISAPGTYTVTVTGTNGCLASNFIIINGNEATSSDLLKVHESLFLNCFPNPFSNQVTINYELPKNGNVSIELNSVLGKRISLLSNVKHVAGVHRYTLAGTDMAPGIYFVTLKYRNNSGDMAYKTLKVVKK